MASNVSIQISADDAELRAKLAVAQSELKEFNGQVRELADGMRETSGAARDELAEQLQAVSAQALAAQREVANLKTELKESTGAAHEHAGALVQIRESAESMNVRIKESVGAFSALGELFLAGLGVEKLMQLAEGAEEWGDKLQKASEETGISVQNLSALSVAADHADVEFDTLQRGFSKFATAIQEGIRGTGNQAEAFHALGISQEELQKNSNNAAAMLELVAQKLDQYDDGANKEAIVTALFGNKLRDMGPILKDLAADGLEGLRSKAAEVGMEFDGEFSEAMKKAHDASVDNKEAFKSLSIELGQDLLPSLTAVERIITQLIAPQTTAALRTSEYKARVNELGLEIDELQGKMNREGAFDRYFDGFALTRAQTELKQVQTNLAALTPEAKKAAEAVAEVEAPKPQAPSIGDQAAQKKALQEQYEAAIAAYRAQTEAYAAGSQQRIAILRQESDLAKETWGENSKQYQEIQGQINAATREATTETGKQSTEMDRLSASFARSASEFTAFGTRVVSENNKVTQSLDNMAREFDAKMSKSILDVQKNMQTAAQLSIKPWTDAFRQIESSLNSNLTGMLNGTESFKQGMAGIATGILDSFVDMGLKMAEHWAETQLENLLIGETTQATAGVAQVTSAAAIAAANAYAATAAIPYIGPELAPFAAAQAEIAVMAFAPQASAAGGYDIPSGLNPIIQGHAEEMMLPASIANPLREMIGRGNSGGHTFDFRHAVFGAGTTQRDVEAGVVNALKSAHRKLSFA